MILDDYVTAQELLQAQLENLRETFAETVARLDALEGNTGNYDRHRLAPCRRTYDRSYELATRIYRGETDNEF